MSVLEQAAVALAVFFGGIVLLRLLSSPLKLVLRLGANTVLGFAALWLLRRVLTRRQMWVAGMAGGICHNVGQIAVAIALTRTPALVVYLPWMVLCGMGTGLFTGLCARFLLEKLPEKLKTW